MAEKMDNKNNPAKTVALRQGKPSNPDTLPVADASDPFLYANMLTSLFGAGALQNLLGGELFRWLDMMIHARRNRQHARQRIEQIQNQVSRVEHLIEQAQVKTTGHHLDKLR